MAPGAGYEPHSDGYDVVIVILEGQLESIGQTLAPHGVFFYAAGELHGARNPGSEITRYVVFEFHARPGIASDHPPWQVLARKLADPRRWRRRLGNAARRLRVRVRRLTRSALAERVHC